MSYVDVIGEIRRRELGIDGTMGDAQDIPHRFDGAGEFNFCVVCGLSRTYRMHDEEWQRCADCREPIGKCCCTEVF